MSHFSSSLLRLIVVLVIGFYVGLTAGPDEHRLLMESIRERPLLGLAYFTIAVMTFGVYFFLFRVFPNQSPGNNKWAKLKAREFSSLKWYVKTVFMFGNDFTKVLDNDGWEELPGEPRSARHGWGMLGLFSVGEDRKVVAFEFEPGHPALSQLPDLCYLQIIEFEYFETALAGTSKNNPTAYFTIKET